MQDISALVGIAVALGIGAVSPGPSFVMVARTAASSNRINGISAAIGMGIGGVLFAALSLLGLIAVLTAVPTIYLLMKIAGGVYLAYLGIQIWRNAKHPLLTKLDGAISLKADCIRYFSLGLSTQLSNPKTAIVYAGVFATFLPAAASLQFKLAVLVLVLAIETTWYSLVAMVLSTETSRNRYLKAKAGIDRLAGGVMFALGLKLVVSGDK